MQILRRWFRVAALAVGIVGAAAIGWPTPAPAAAAAGDRLLGTVVGENVKSSALFGEGSGFFWVKEGEDVEPGLRLIEVDTDGVVLKEQTSGQDVRVLIGDTPSRAERAAPMATATAPAAPPVVRRKNPADMSPEELRRLSEKIKARFERLRAASPRHRRRREAGPSEDDDE